MKQRTISLDNSTTLPLLGIVGLVAALSVYSGWLLISSIVFLIITIAAMAATPVQRIPFSWQFGIPAYYCCFLFFLPILKLWNQDIALDATDDELAVAFAVLSVAIVSFVAGAKLYSGATKETVGMGFSQVGAFNVLVEPWAIMVLIVLGVVSNVWSYQFGYYGLHVNTYFETNIWSGAIAVFSGLLTIAHVIAWTVYWRHRHRLYLVIGLISMTIMFISGVISNSKGQILAPFVFTAIGYWGVTGRFPFRQALIGLLMYILFVYPLITSLRYGLLASSEDATRMELAAGILDTFFSGEWFYQDIVSTAASSIGRGLLEYFAVVVSQSGANVEYLYGETFLRGFEIVVPRFLNPDKPDMNIGNWTAQSFGAIGSLDNITNLSPTFVGEFYMNFGILGVVVGMFLMGIVAILVDRYIVGDRTSWTMPLVMSAIFWQESFLGHTFLPFLKNLVLMLPVLLALNAVLFLTTKASRGTSR